MRWSHRGAIPPVYALLDGDTLRRRGIDLMTAARFLRSVGAGLVQFREKSLPREAIRESAGALAECFRGTETILLLNDHVGLAAELKFSGVHLGQGDMPVQTARRLLGHAAIIGLSTHTADEVRAADAEDVDYVAIGPVFATQTKQDAEAAVGLNGVLAARALTGKPLVAIGGIGPDTARAVMAAGADSIAVVGALLRSESELASRWTALRQAVSTDPS